MFLAIAGEKIFLLYGGGRLAARPLLSVVSGREYGETIGMLVASGKQPSGAYTKLSMAAVSEVYVGA